MKRKKRSQSKIVNEKNKKNRRKYEKNNRDGMIMYDFLHSPVYFPGDKTTIFHLVTLESTPKTAGEIHDRDR